MLPYLNAHGLGTQFLQSHEAEAAASLRFVERLSNPEAFVDTDPEKSLKVCMTVWGQGTR